MKPFHLRLESNVAAAFPLMKRFGTITIDVYPAGFRATTIWLRAFSRNPRTITLENPLSRTYVERPMSAIGDIVRFVAGRSTNIGAPRTVQVHTGKAAGLPSHRFRLIYDRTNFVDVWTTTALGPTPAFRAFAEELRRDLIVHAVSVEVAELAGRIEGEQAARGVSITLEDLLIGATALHVGFGVVTLNIRHFQAIPGLSVLAL